MSGIKPKFKNLRTEPVNCGTLCPAICPALGFG